MVVTQKRVKIILAAGVCIPTLSWRFSLYVKCTVYLFFSFTQYNHVPLCIKGLCNDLNNQKTNEQNVIGKEKSMGENPCVCTAD